MTLTILSRSNRINQDVTDVRVKTDDWEGTLAISGLEEMEAGSLEAAAKAKLKSLIEETVFEIMNRFRAYTDRA